MENKIHISEIENLIDWKVIDQLHAATIEFSRNCTNLKKICVTLLIATSTLLAKFTSETIDISFFVAGTVIPLFFWGLDATSYFYQEKLRNLINDKLNGLKERNSQTTLITPVGYVLEVDRKVKNRLWRSIFNPSMLLYYILLVLCLILFICFKMKLI